MINQSDVSPSIVIRNPVLRGFNPDPSILRVEEDYYIATSTFEWFPGVQIHHSRDLVSWSLRTRPLDRASQLDMIGNADSGGVWAPCLSHDGKTFYLIYSDVKQWKEEPYKIVRNYLVTAQTIDGPWSDPIFLNSSGFDPSLFHDADGRKWLVSMEWDHRKGRERFSGILLQEFCPSRARLIGPVRKIFEGTAIGSVEGPHLYHREGTYYLITAEGGTEYQHAVTMARSKKLEGPYEVHPENPILSSDQRPELALQKAGHGSLVETPEGEWYLAHLCGRPIDGKHCILGRETALQKCVWRDDGWLSLASGASYPETTTPAPAGVQMIAPPRVGWEGNFNTSQLDLNFQSLRRPMTEDWLSLTERPGWLRLKGQEPTTSLFRQSLVARRVQAFAIEVTTEVEFQPENFQQMAGLITYYDTRNHYYLRISRDNERGRNLDIIQTVGGVSGELLSVGLSLPENGPIRLRACLDHTELWFSFSIGESDWIGIGETLESKVLSDDYDHLGFTGAFVGLCAQDLTQTRHPADFKFFNYREQPDGSLSISPEN